MIRPAVVRTLLLLALTSAPGALLAQPRPGEPEDLEGEALSATSIRLEWEEYDARAETFNVYRDGNLIGNTDEEQYTDTGLTPDTEYEYWVRGVDDKGREGRRSEKIRVRTLPDDTPPPKMSRPLATAVFSTRIDLAWAAGSDPESGITAYRLRRDGTVIATVSGRSYEDEGLEAFTEYEYRLSAINGVGLEGPQSDRLVRRTLDGTAPSVPADLRGSATSPTEISLDWSAASDPESGVSEYRVFRNGNLIVSLADPGYDDSGLSPGTEYEYEVSAVNGAGLESSRTAPVRITTQREADTTPPTVPSGVQAEATSARDVRVTWSASTDDESGVAVYRVYRDDTLIAELPALSFVDGERTPDTEYRYQVSAVNGEGLESERSPEAVVRTPAQTDTTPPSAPGGLAARAVSPTRIDLDWTAATDAESGVAFYRVYRDGGLLDMTTGLTFADEALIPGVTYSYEVSAVNGDGLEGAKTDAVLGTPPLVLDTVAPMPPTGLRVVSP